MINIVLDKTTGVRTACTCVSEKVEGKESETTLKYCFIKPASRGILSGLKTRGKIHGL